VRRSCTTWRAHGIRPRFEDHLDPGEPGNRLGPDVVEPGHPIEQVLLHGNGDHLLDFRRGEPERFGLNFHSCRDELRQDVHRHSSHFADAENYHAHGDCYDEESQLQARFDNRTHH
jgi:hypothetical protein